MGVDCVGWVGGVGGWVGGWVRGWVRGWVGGWLGGWVGGEKDMRLGRRVVAQWEGNPVLCCLLLKEKKGCQESPFRP